MTHPSCLTGLQCCKALSQLWLLYMRTAGFMGTYPLAHHPLQGSKLKAGGLVSGGHVIMTYSHAPILAVIYDASNSLFL